MIHTGSKLQIPPVDPVLMASRLASAWGSSPTVGTDHDRQASSVKMTNESDTAKTQQEKKEIQVRRLRDPVPGSTG